MNTLFFIVILIFAVFIVIGYIRGLFKSVCKMVLMVCALLLAYLLTPILTQVVIQNTKIDDAIYDKVHIKIESYITDKVRKETVELLGYADEQYTQAVVDAMMQTELTRNKQVEIIQEIPFPKFMQDALLEHNNPEEKRELGTSSFFEYLATYITHMVLRAIVFFVLLVVLVVIFTIIVAVVSLATRLPIVNSVNRIGGMLFGALEGVLVVWALFVVIAMAARTSFGVEAYRQITENSFLQMLYDKNILMSIVTVFK